MQNGIIKLAGAEYTPKKLRRGGSTMVYEGPNTFLRIGNPKTIKREIKLLGELNKLGFPVPKKLKEGKIGKQYYYIETSLGKQHFSEIFRDDIAKSGKITDKNFKRFIDITKKFAEAQLKTQIKTKNWAGVATGIHLRYILSELPEYKKEIIQRFEAAKKALVDYPFVLTHGDYSSHNLCPKGVIDFEEMFYGPAGYDIVGSLYQIQQFPKSKKYEFYKWYDFTAIHRKLYLKIFDNLYVKHGLPKLSTNVKHFEFLRAVWLVVRIHHLPKLQKFRYDLFKRQFLR